VIKNLNQWLDLRYANVNAETQKVQCNITPPKKEKKKNNSTKHLKDT
jgi:hypothetical protein